MYAVDDLGDAIDVTREFLTPVRVGMWLKLVLVVFFVSGAGMSGGTPPVGDVGMFVDGPSVDIEQVDEDVPADPVYEELPVEELLTVAIVLFVVGFALWLIFSVLRAIMDFVFVESLRSSEVHVRRYGTANLARALRLFLFRVVVSIVAFGPLVIGFVVVALSAEALEEIALASLGLLVLLAIPIYLLYAIVMRFTTVFVVPVMLLEERGVLSAWRRFVPTFTANWAEYVVYLILVWILWIIVGIALAFLAFVGFLLIGIPFAILAFVLALLGPIGIALAAVTLIAAFVLFLVYVTLLQVPIYSYFRYYALLVLGDTNGDLDLIPAQRAAVRSDGGREARDDWAAADRRADERDDRDDDRRASRAEDEDDRGEGGWDDDTDGWDTSSDWDDETSDWDDDDRRW